MTRRPSKKICMAPMAVTSAGDVLLNMAEFQDDLSPSALVRNAKAIGFALFVGVVVPERLRRRLARDIDDAAADITGRLGGMVSAGPDRESVSAPSSGAQAPGRRGPGGRQAPRPRGRRP